MEREVSNDVIGYGGLAVVFYIIKGITINPVIIVLSYLMGRLIGRTLFK